MIRKLAANIAQNEGLKSIPYEKAQIASSQGAEISKGEETRGEGNTGSTLKQNRMWRGRNSKLRE